MKKLSCFLFLMCLGIQTNLLMAQNVNIASGHVSDERGNTIEGATVMETGLPGNSTATDKGGNFTITLKGVSNSISTVPYLIHSLFRVGGNRCEGRSFGRFNLTHMQKSVAEIPVLHR